MNENKINDDSNSSESRPNSSRFPPITAHPKSATLRDRRIPLYSRSTSFDISSKRPKSSTGHNVVDNQLISSKRVNNSFPCLVMSESPAKIQSKIK